MNDKPSKTYRISWQNVEIDVRHTPDYWSAVKRVYGYSMDHLEVIAVEPDRAPLPITETGYRSIFLNSTVLGEFDTPAEYVLAALDAEAVTEKWLERKAAADQLSLF